MDFRGRYIPLEEAKESQERCEDGTSFSEDSTDVEGSVNFQDQRSRKAISAAFRPRVLCVVIVVDMLLLITSFAMAGYSWLGIASMTNHQLIMATNSYSPLFSRTTFQLQDETLKTALINRHNQGGPSIYREAPSPEVDEAWRKLHKGDRLFLISKEEVLQLGKNPDLVIRAPLEWGYGEDQYLAVAQGQHDIHCLNYIRMWIYRDHYYGNKTGDVEIHALHCLHALLQTLQCKYSTDVFTAFWVEGSAPPVVDFNVTRRCQNYDNILHWNPEKPYTEEQFAALKPPPGQKRIPADVY